VVRERRDGPAERVLEVRGFGRRFGDHEVLANLDFSVAAGERLALTGANGSGKTTLLRCISGTLAPSEGSVRICSHEASSLEARRRTGTSLSQERSFYLRLTGRDNLLFFARLRRGGDRQARRAVDAIVEELELAEIAAERTSRCSTGMIQQLAFGRALLGEPDLLVLDEPTRSLDLGAVERLWSAIERRPSTALLVATHRSEDIERCDQRIHLGGAE
jgi:ABC-2 type transport system ATP-binding protein